MLYHYGIIPQKGESVMTAKQEKLRQVHIRLKPDEMQELQGICSDLNLSHSRAVGMMLQIMKSFSDNKELEKALLKTFKKITV